MRDFNISEKPRRVRKSLDISTTKTPSPFETSIKLCREKDRRGDDTFTEKEVIIILLDIRSALASLRASTEELKEESAKTASVIERNGTDCTFIFVNLPPDVCISLN